MRNIRWAALLLALIGCGSTSQDPLTTRQITLTKGDTLAVAVDTRGKVAITATVLAGKRDAGTYVTHAEALLDDARAAKNALSRAGATVSLRVDGHDRIVSISLTQRLD